MITKDFRENGTILIGACGSISVLNLHLWILYLRSTLCKNINVILTDQAAKFISADSLELITGTPIYTNLRGQSAGYLVPHIELTQKSDLFLVLPATANIIGKAANGIADDLLSTAIIAANCPLIFVPVMNMQMWNSGVVKRNIRLLEEVGYKVIPPNFKGKGYKVSTGEIEQEVPEVDMGVLSVNIARIINQNQKKEK